MDDSRLTANYRTFVFFKVNMYDFSRSQPRPFPIVARSKPFCDSLPYDKWLIQCLSRSDGIIVPVDMRFKEELALTPDLGHQLQRLRWFRLAFRANARAVAAVYGMRFEIDDTRLAKAFFDWIETVETNRSFAAVDRADFIRFAAGLALRELIRQNPARAIVPALPQHPADDKMKEIVLFWPEGFLYTNYCVSAIAAIHEQEFGHAPSIDACADDLRTWWSYRENVTEMPSSAIAFLDRFFGAEPDWILPDSAGSRRAMRDALGPAGARGIPNH